MRGKILVIGSETYLRMDRFKEAEALFREAYPYNSESMQLHESL
jgi:hypothetical protein